MIAIAVALAIGVGQAQAAKAAANPAAPAPAQTAVDQAYAKYKDLQEEERRLHSRPRQGRPNVYGIAIVT
jgi:hypothetical protein